MIKNKAYIIISTVIICLGLVIFGLSNRYYIDTSTKLKVDKLTGKTYQLTNKVWQEVGNDQSTKSDTSNTTYDAYYEELRYIISTLEIFKNDATLHSEFVDYYNNIVAETKKDEFYYRRGKPVEKTYGSYTITDWQYPENKFGEYGRTFFTIEKIAKTTSANDNIKSADDYIDYVISYYQNQLPK